MTYADGKKCMKELEAKGWVHTCTVISDSQESGRFGMLYVKGEKQFWLNKNTYKNLP
jgi:hypothetical protein